MLLYTFAFEAVIRFSFEEVSEQMSRERWVPAFLACVHAASRGCKLIRSELLDMKAGEGAEFLDRVYDGLILLFNRTEPRRAGDITPRSDGGGATIPAMYVRATLRACSTAAHDRRPKPERQRRRTTS